MTTTPTAAARVRAMVDHPIIDADGHFVEVGPLLHDEVISYVEDAGGAALRDRFLATAASFDTSSSLADRADPDRARPVAGDAVVVGLADGATCATAPPSHLPALLYERLDELGIDFTILYPSMALGYFEVTDEELSSVLCRAVNRYHAARVRAVPRPLHGRRADPDEHARAGRSRKPSTRSRELGAKSLLMAGYARRPVGGGRLPPRHVRPRQRPRLRPVLGDVRGAGRRAGRAQRVAAAPGHAVDLELRLQPRQRAGRRARVAVQVAVPRRCHPSVPRAARRLPRGRRGVGVRAVRRAGRPLGEAQPRRDPRARPRSARRRRAARSTSSEYGDDAVTRRLDDLRDVLRSSGGASRADRRVRRGRHRHASTTSAPGSTRTSTSAARPTTRSWRGRSATT